MIDKEQMTFNSLIENLEKSTMFHMSLASKELFHSNFLHWISITNWDVFLKVMHDLSGMDSFWWETDFHPKNNNIKVLREHRNFDLSIYILESEQSVKVDEDTKAENVRSEEGTINPNDEKTVQKWTPVLILENKMKSLPYKEQLEKYTQRAFEEWCTRDIIKKRAKECLNKEYVNNNGITFILLSLMKPSLDKYEFTKDKVYHRPKYQLTLTGQWIYKTYEDLLGSLKNCPKFDKELDKLIVEDYCQFLNSLCILANNYWKIEPDKSFRSQISPWDRDNALTDEFKSKIEELEKYKMLRIHDIHEKLLYDQLLISLEQKLKYNSIPFSRYSKETIQGQETKEKDKIRLFTNLSYAHGVGIFEVQYILSKSFIPKGKKKELLKLIIQVQGDRYCHMVVYDNIVDKENTINMVELKNQWEDNLKQPMRDTLGKYVSIDDSYPDKVLGKELSQGYSRYGENLIYQYVIIPPTFKIQDVIDAIIGDIKKISEWFT